MALPSSWSREAVSGRLFKMLNELPISASTSDVANSPNKINCTYMPYSVLLIP